MSELKAWTAQEIANSEKNFLMSPIKVYIKSEADKVIAELKQKLNEAQTELELWRDGSIISEAHQKELDEKRHSDYKRCLAMAKRCFTKANYHFVLARHGEDVKVNYRKSVLYSKWHERWLIIAEKFKEASNGSQV